MLVRISDIAKVAGVSNATVSRVISGKPGVGKQTTERVKKIIKEMGYRPSVSARYLAQQKTGNIAILSARGSNMVWGNPFFSKILEGVSKVLDTLDYNMIPSFTLSQQKKLINTHQVDGILLFAPRTDDQVLQWLNSTEIPSVIVGSYKSNSRYPSVRPHDEQGIHDAVEYLIDNGHKKIALVNGPLTSVKSIRCKEGYLKAMKNAKIAIDDVWLIENKEYDMNESYNLLDDYFKKSKLDVTAIVCSSDYLALGVLKAAIKNKIKVPNQLSIIGFGNIPLTDFSQPQLTTMHTNLHEIGMQAAQDLNSLIEGDEIEKKDKIFSMKLIERGSVKNKL